MTYETENSFYAKPELFDGCNKPLFKTGLPLIHYFATSPNRN